MPELAGTLYDEGRIRAKLQKWKERLLDLSRANPLLGINRSRVTKLRVTGPGPMRRNQHARLSEVDVLKAGDDDVLVRVAAASANALDRHFLRGHPFVMRIAGGGVPPRVRAASRDGAVVIPTAPGVHLCAS